MNDCRPSHRRCGRAVQLFISKHLWLIKGQYVGETTNVCQSGAGKRAPSLYSICPRQSASRR